MTAQGWDEANGPAMAEVGPGEQGQVVRRGNQLCLRAEPHTDVVPCPAHLHEAKRQLLALVV